MSVGLAKLEFNHHDNSIKTFELNDETVTIGRAPENSLVLVESIISRHHAQIKRQSGRYFLVDTGSFHGTYLNGAKLVASTPRPLSNGDAIGIGNYQLRFCCPQAQPSAGNETTVLGSVGGTAMQKTAPLQPLSLRGRKNLTIGRDADSDTVIDHPAVSRFHAQIQQRDGSFQIADLKSTNGTFVNGKQIKGKRILKVGDIIRIGPCTFTLKIDETLVKQNEQGNLQLDAVHLNKVVGKGINLLNDISLSIKAREFVVIAGVSGGGKSTLLDALNGFRPATSGQVLVNGVDLYKNFNAYRTDIGYVPQKDIVHMELTVEQALEFAARLRMPSDTTTAERRTRVDEVLEDLGLSHRRDVPVKALSGGQLKRVSIGVELLTKPSLFFLDEATSGLDPGTEAEIMKLLRKLADQGRTIVLITHATENVKLCDKVVFLAKGGNLAYFGPSQEAPEYFGVKTFNGIYPQVERELSPQEYQQRYVDSPLYEQYIAAGQKSLQVSPGRALNRPRQQLPGGMVKQVSVWQQLLILSQRNLAILTRDRAGLILMLAVAPILGALDFFTWQNNLFDVYRGDAGQAITMLFNTALIAVMVGSLATMREIVKEQEIYRRERMIGLKILPYLLSKVWVSIILVLYQGAVFLLFKLLAVDIPRAPSILLAMYGTLVLATISGMVMGLLVSAISPNQNIAPLLTIIFIVPQITFGGGVLPIDTFGPPGQLINHLTLTKRPFESLITLTNLGADVANDACWALPEDKRKNLSDGDKEKCDCLGKSVFKACKFPGIEAKYDKVVEQSEPQKPPEPGDPPQAPTKPDSNSFQAQQEYEEDLDQYQEDIDAYQEKVDQYQAGIDEWQEKYSDWKGKYESAVGEAEGIIARFNQDFGSMFAVNLGRYGSIQILLIAAMFGLLLVAQQRKDII